MADNIYSLDINLDLDIDLESLKLKDLSMLYDLYYIDELPSKDIRLSGKIAHLNVKRIDIAKSHAQNGVEHSNVAHASLHVSNASAINYSAKTSDIISVDVNENLQRSIFTAKLENILKGTTTKTTTSEVTQSAISENTDKYIIVQNTYDQVGSTPSAKIKLLNTGNTVYTGLLTNYLDYVQTQNSKRIEYYTNFGTVYTGDGDDKLYTTSVYSTYYYDGIFLDKTNTSDSSKYTPAGLNGKGAGIYYIIPPVDKNGSIIAGDNSYKLTMSVHGGAGNNFLYTSTASGIIYLDPNLSMAGSMWGFNNIYLGGSQTIYLNNLGLNQLSDMAIFAISQAGTVYLGDKTDTTTVASSKIYYVDSKAEKNKFTLWNLSSIYLTSGDDTIYFQSLKDIQAPMRVTAKADETTAQQTNTAYISDLIENDTSGMLDLSRISLVNFKDIYLRQTKDNTVYLGYFTTDNTNKMKVHGTASNIDKLIINAASDTLYNIFNRFIGFDSFYLDSSNTSITLYTTDDKNFSALEKDTTVYGQKSLNTILVLSNKQETVYYKNSGIDNIYDYQGVQYKTKFTNIGGIQTYYNVNSDGNVLYIDSAKVTLSGSGLKNLSLASNDVVYFGDFSPTPVNGSVWDGTLYIKPTEINFTDGEIFTSLNISGKPNIHLALSIYADSSKAGRYYSQLQNNTKVNISGLEQINLASLYLTGDSSTTVDIRTAYFTDPFGTSNIEIEKIGKVYSTTAGDYFYGNFFEQTKNNAILSTTVDTYKKSFSIFWDGGAGNDTFIGSFVELSTTKRADSDISNKYFNLIDINNVENILVSGSPYYRIPSASESSYIGGVISVYDNPNVNVTITPDSTQEYKYNLALNASSSTFSIHVNQDNSSNTYVDYNNNKIFATKLALLSIEDTNTASIYLDYTGDLTHSLEIRPHSLLSNDTNKINNNSTIYGNDNDNIVALGSKFDTTQSHLLINNIKNVVLGGGNDTVYVGRSYLNDSLLDSRHQLDGGIGIDTLKLIQQQVGNSLWYDNISSFEHINISMDRGSTITLNSTQFLSMIKNNTTETFGSYNISLSLDLDNTFTQTNIPNQSVSYNAKGTDATGSYDALMQITLDSQFKLVSDTDTVDVFEITDSSNNKKYIKIS